MPFTGNYHTHTYRCKHATGDVSDYCREAVRQGFTILGMSDHTALPDNRWPGVRMDFRELPDYCRAVDEAREMFPQLTVLKGMECEFSDSYLSYYRDTLLDELQFDYLIGAAHFFPLNGEWIGSFGGIDTLAGLRAYVTYFIESMESGLFAFMAHPDLFGNSYHTWDVNTASAAKDIFQAAADLAIPLEINGYGLRKPLIDTPEGKRRMYPWLPFWELASDYDITVVVNSDAHHPNDVGANMSDAAAIGERYGLPFADLSYLQKV